MTGPSETRCEKREEFLSKRSAMRTVKVDFTMRSLGTNDHTRHADERTSPEHPE